MMLAVSEPLVHLPKYTNRPLLKAYQWVEFCSDQKYPEQIQGLSRTNPLISWLNLPRKISRVFPKKLSGIEYGAAFVKNILSITALFATTVRIAVEEKFLAVSGRAMEILKGVGLLSCFAVFVRAVIGLRHLPAIYKASSFPYFLTKLTIKISTIALSALSIAAFALSCPAGIKLSILIVSTVSITAKNVELVYNKLLK